MESWYDKGSYVANTFAERFPSQWAFDPAPDWSWYTNQVLQYQQSTSYEAYPVDTFAERFDAVYGGSVLPYGSDASYLRSEGMLGHGELDYYW